MEEMFLEIYQLYVYESYIAGIADLTIRKDKLNHFLDRLGEEFPRSALWDLVNAYARMVGALSYLQGLRASL